VTREGFVTDWANWVGREERRRDRLDPALAARWLATFDLPAQTEGAMPQGIHFCLCTPDAPTAALGEDGHPKRDDSAASFFPPIPLPRRMWAASAIDFLAPIAIGAEIERVSRIASITPKSGKSGEMVFVEVLHETSADGALAARETQTLVYREEAAPNAPLQPAPLGDSRFDSGEWQNQRALTPNEPLLFRFSALTFNTHRIHYDLPYARDVERYRGLVVHGPLMASLLLQLAGPIRRFAFRAVSPAVAGEPLHLVAREEGDSLVLGAFADDRRQVVQAEATR
jgi:3-methylfumaryl-CoA hydratase